MWLSNGDKGSIIASVVPRRGPMPGPVGWPPRAIDVPVPMNGRGVPLTAPTTRRGAIPVVGPTPPIALGRPRITAVTSITYQEADALSANILADFGGRDVLQAIPPLFLAVFVHPPRIIAGVDKVEHQPDPWILCRKVNGRHPPAYITLRLVGFRINRLGNGLSVQIQMDGKDIIRQIAHLGSSS